MRPTWRENRGAILHMLTLTWILQLNYRAQQIYGREMTVKEVMREIQKDEMFSSFENVKRIIPHLQMFYADVKCMDPGKHKKWTGQDNAIILENIRRADVYQRMCFQLKSPIDRSVFLVYAYSVC